MRSKLPEVLILSQHEEKMLIRYLLDVWSNRDGFRIHYGPYEGIELDTCEQSLEEFNRPPEKGTADALLKNARHIFESRFNEIMVLHADHVYRYDYRQMLRYHRATGAALTMGYQKIGMEYVKLFGMVELDADSNVTNFVEKPSHPTHDTVFTAVCIFDIDRLDHYLRKLNAGDWQYDLSKDVIPAMLAGGERVKGYAFRDYWEDIGTVQRYYRAHLGLLGGTPSMGLTEMPHTLFSDVLRHYIGAEKNIKNAIVPEDLNGNGVIENSVLYPRTEVADGAMVKDSILLPGARVLPGARIEHAIILEGQVIEHGCVNGGLR
jgi:glucose-1-phosphate adenylyltransferase